MDKVIQYYIEVLSLYHNLPQMDEYLKFHGLTEKDIDDFKKK